MTVTGTTNLLAVTTVAQLPPPRQPTVTSAKSYTLEWIIVGVCVAAALYAVCRPSRRS